VSTASETSKQQCILTSTPQKLPNRWTTRSPDLSTTSFHTARQGEHPTPATRESHHQEEELARRVQVQELFPVVQDKGNGLSYLRSASESTAFPAFACGESEPAWASCSVVRRVYITTRSSAPVQHSIVRACALGAWQRQTPIAVDHDLCTSLQPVFLSILRRTGSGIAT
jgi:hypothetical protein